MSNEIPEFDPRSPAAFIFAALRELSLCNDDFNQAAKNLKCTRGQLAQRLRHAGVKLKHLQKKIEAVERRSKRNRKRERKILIAARKIEGKTKAPKYTAPHVRISFLEADPEGGVDIKSMDRQGVIDLFLKYKAMNVDERKTAFSWFLPVVKSICVRLAFRHYCDPGDLVSVVFKAVHDAIVKYDVESAGSSNPIAYLNQASSYRVLDCIRNEGVFTRSMSTERSKIDSAVCKMTAIGLSVNDDSIAEFTGINAEKIAKARSKISSIDEPSLSRVGCRDDGSMINSIARKEGQDEYFKSLSEFADSIIGLIKNERDSEILRMHYVKGMTMSEIGESIGMSGSRVSQIITAAMSLIKERVAVKNIVLSDVL